MKTSSASIAALVAALCITSVANAATNGPPVPLAQGTRLGAAKFPDGDTSTGGNGQVIDGIEGSSQEMLKTHIHVHLSLFYKGEQVAVPLGIGIVRPFTVTRGFVEGGSAYYWLHTHDASGIVHVESPNDRVYTLGNFFDIWGEPLSAQNVAGMEGPVKAYVNGTIVFSSIRDIPLRPHDQITLQIGAPNVPPPNYLFPEGL